MPALREDAALEVGFGDVVDGDGVGGGGHVDGVLVGGEADSSCGVDDRLLEFGVDAFEFPSYAAFVLDPFQVAHSHAAGVAEDGGEDGDVAVGEEGVGFGGAGAVAAFGEDAAVEPFGDLLVDHAFEGGGDEDVDGGAVPGFAVDGFDVGVGVGVAFDGAIGGDVLGEVDGIDDAIGGGGAHGAGVIHGGDELGTEVLQDDGGIAADVAEAQHAEAHAFDVDEEFGEEFLQHVDDALAGGFFAAFGAAAGDGFSGDDVAEVLSGLAFMGVEVGVHHPIHDLGIGADVRGGDVGFGADDIAEGGGEAAGESHEFVVGEFAGVDLDAAFSAAEGETHDGAFHGHPGGEGLAVFEGHFGVEADAALVGSEDVVVLDAVAFEDFVGAVVELDGEVDDVFIFGLAEDGLDVFGGLEDVAGAVDGGDGHGEEGFVVLGLEGFGVGEGVGGGRFGRPLWDS